MTFRKKNRSYVREGVGQGTLGGIGSHDLLTE